MILSSEDCGTVSSKNAVAQATKIRLKKKEIELKRA
jgi:hypothetical protein